MPENRKSSGNIIVAVGMKAAIAIAISVFLLACSQTNQVSMVGYWTPGISCDRRFFEMTKDFKFYQWKWDKKWDGYVKDPDVTPSSYTLTGNNKITISGINRKEKKQILSGTFERISAISAAKIKISNVKVTRDEQPVKDAPAEIILTKCDENIAELLKK